MSRGKYSDLPRTKASIVLVLGETGAGKSFFIDKLAPGEVRIGHSLRSCTQDPQLVKAKAGATEFFLIDTPGFDDTVRSDGDILLTISRMITAQYKLGIKLKGIIYVHSIREERMRQSSVRQLELLRKICGDKNVGNVLLVTTRWNNGLTNGLFAQRERELRNEYWEHLINGGAKTLRFHGTQDSAVSIVSQLLGKEEVVLALQHEMVDRNLKLNETSAGLFVAKARGSIEKEYWDLRAREGVASSPRLDDLRESLEKSRDDEEKLRIDVIEEVGAGIDKKIEIEFKKNGRRPSIVNIISWIISLAGVGLSYWLFVYVPNLSVSSRVVGHICCRASTPTSHARVLVTLPSIHPTIARNSNRALDMRSALKLLQRGGFLKRSLDEIKANTHKVFSMQGVTGDFDDMEIHSFRHPSSLESIRTFSDADMGGFSKVKMDLAPLPTGDGEEKQYYGRFHGSISIELPPDKPNIQRSGYAAWRTVQRERTLFGRPFWNIDPYAFLALRIKSDGSKYFINIQTDSIVETDLHQHRLFAKTPGQWEIIHIPISEFVRTNYGRVTEPQGEMLREKVRTIGIGLIDRIPGPFELCIDRIWATNHVDSVSMPKPHREVYSSPKMIIDTE